MLREIADVPAGIQAVEAIGVLTADDYRQVLKPMVSRVRCGGSRMRLLYQFGPEFRRVTPGALWADTRLGIDYLRLLDGCAVVSDIEWIRQPSHSISAWMSCPVHVYHTAELDEAVAWLSALPRAANRSVGVRDLATAFTGGVVGAAGSLARLAIWSTFKTQHRLD